MDPYKALGPDGFHAVFYQKSWEVVGPHVCSFALNFLNDGILPEGVCDILVTLLPKVANPEYITQFRPISACNVMFKILTKALTCRL